MTRPIILKILILLGLFGLISFLWLSLKSPNQKLLVVNMLDIGQGDSIHIRLPSQHDILIDIGPDSRTVQKLDQVMPWHDRTIELLVISHNHLDHIGGLRSLIGHYQVKMIWLSGAQATTREYLTSLRAIKEAEIPIITVKAGDRSLYEQTELLLLHPISSQIDQTPHHQHNATVAAKLNYKNFCLLLTGDLEANNEQAILDWSAQQQISLDCTALKVSHHGSRNTSSQAWLERVSPTIALISAGQDNRYRHPHPETLARLNQFGTTIFRTDQDGTVTLITDGYQFWTKPVK